MAINALKFITALALTAVAAFPVGAPQTADIPDGAVIAGDVLSYCAGAVADDGGDLLLAITGGGSTDAGERYGDCLLVCAASAVDTLETSGYIPPDGILNRIDLGRIKPMKIMSGDVNGDGKNEVSICAYKTANFHPVMAKRPYFFNISGYNLVPLWLGSRLSRPFSDYTLYDFDGDGADELVSDEYLHNGDRVVAAYKWKGFGFELFAQSDAIDEASFVPAGQRKDRNYVLSIMR